MEPILVNLLGGLSVLVALLGVIIVLREVVLKTRARRKLIGLLKKQLSMELVEQFRSEREPVKREELKQQILAQIMSALTLLTDCEQRAISGGLNQVSLIGRDLYLSSLLGTITSMQEHIVGTPSLRPESGQTSKIPTGTTRGSFGSESHPIQEPSEEEFTEAVTMS